MWELVNGTRINLSGSNSNFGMMGAHRDGFKPNFDFDFLNFFQILGYLFPYKLFQSQENILWWKLYWDIIRNGRQWINLEWILNWPPRGGLKWEQLAHFLNFFEKKTKYFFVIVTYNNKNPPVSMPKGPTQYIWRKK